MKRLRTIFITGCLALVPLIATTQILLWFVRWIDSNIRNIFPSGILPEIPGLGVLIALTVILTAGAITQLYVGKWLINLMDHGIRRISVVGGLYGSIRKFLETVFNPRSDQFQGTVLVEFPRPGIYSIAFRTGKPDPKLQRSKDGRKLTNVFMPCTPNPTSGFYLLVPEEDLIPLDLSVQEAFKIVISLGIVTSEPEIEPSLS